MKFLDWKNTISLLLLLTIGGCVEPYLPEVMQAPNSYLVVNGFINADGPTTIQLYRTQNLSDGGPVPVEDRAIVMIQAEDGEQYRVHEEGNGVYVSDKHTLNFQKKYRLFIRTNKGDEYASDYVEVKQTPAIDAMDWAPVDRNVEIMVSTQDPNNKTWYYRWDYEHTWHYRSAFSTILKYEDGVVSYRSGTDEEIYNCWRTENSTAIKLSNSTKLSQDVISNYKILAIPYNSEKIGIKYSILVKQYALTREAYAYWEVLKRNTENIGTLFDPLPSQLPGNIHSLTNPAEVVIGFMSASTSQERRIFISSSDLPREWRTFYPTCYADTLFLDKNVSNLKAYFGNGASIPVSEVYAENSPTVIGYTYAAKDCVDCRTRGTNVKPDFWE